MARSVRDLPFTGTLGKVCVVESETYGEHVRRARGTVKKAEVNDVMKENGERMIASNAAARLINDALKPFRENFAGGLFWQNLVKHFTAQAKKGEPYSLKGLEGKEIHKAYPLDRLIRGPVNVEGDMEQKTIRVSMDYWAEKRFLTRNPSTKGFQLTMIAFFVDFTRMQIAVSQQMLPFKYLTDKEPSVFSLAIPEGFSSYMLCCKAEGAEDHKSVEKVLSKKGMKILVVKDLSGMDKEDDQEEIIPATSANRESEGIGQ
jgi:hypothetical protein